MKGPRWVMGMFLCMLFWGISSGAAYGLRLAAWLLDFEKDYKKIRDEVDAIHEMQEAAQPGFCAMCGRADDH